MGNGSWQTSPVFTGLSPATTYVFSQRIRETSDSLPSAESVRLQVTTEKNAGKTAPKPTVAAVTSTSVTLNAVSGCEYRVGNGAWQTSPLFEGLSPATSYVFYQRYAETSSAFAGGSSAGTSVTTDKKSGKTAPAHDLEECVCRYGDSECLYRHGVPPGRRNMAEQCDLYGAVSEYRIYILSAVCRNGRQLCRSGKPCPYGRHLQAGRRNGRQSRSWFR